MLKGKVVLICPLNWGLGHVTRCIPIINKIEGLGAEIVLGSSGQALTALRQLFPKKKIFELPDYRVKYQSRGSLTWKMLCSLPMFLKSIKLEKLVLDKIIAEVKPDFIISDNRYGVWDNNIPSVLIIHQLNIQSRFLSSIINQLHAQWINRFKEVWVPDFPGEASLSGKLSTKNKYLLQSVKHIGPWSNIWNTEIGEEEVIKQKLQRDYLVVLSGPEPQRTILEKKILEIFGEKKETVLVVRGLLINEEVKSISNNIELINYLSSYDLSREMRNSKIIISRPGYSTIMDLIALGGRLAIFIPTPGQTEQEYLAQLHQASGCFCSISQKELTYKKLTRVKFEGTKPSQKVNNFQMIENRIKVQLKLT